MKSDKLRIVVPIAVLIVIVIGYVFSQPIGTLSALGWKDISLLCPLGAISQIVATKTAVPRVVIALVLSIAAIVILGRAFCGWICPIPVISKLRDAFSSKESQAKSVKAENAKHERGRTEKRLASQVSHGYSSCSRGCGTCASKKNIDSRHIVLGGALLSTALFGFPVFCLVCPLGLTFASAFLLFNLFAYADLTWTAVLVPVLLLTEVVFFRKWCTHACPISALMSLVAKANRSFLPAIDNEKCLESSQKMTCGVCFKVCDQGIDPRHPELGNNWSECTKCRKCVEACPGSAITMPLIPRRNESTALPDIVPAAKEK